MKKNVLVVGELRDAPTEGAQVVTKALVAKLADSHVVRVAEPSRLASWLPRALSHPADHVIFTHGPGRGVVSTSLLLRNLTRSRITWIATRPDLGALPPWLKGRRTAHSVICNVSRKEIAIAARGADTIQQFIGIDPERLRGSSAGGQSDLIAAARAQGKKIALHVGHLRPNRGLQQLAEAKNRLGGRAEVFVQSSPSFPSDPEVLDVLASAGVHVLKGTVSDLGRLYQSADVYVFPTRPSDGGAIDLPLSVLEAVASGVPVVTTDFGSISAALAGVRGVHVAPRDGFVDLLEAILTDPQALSIRPAGLPSQLHIDALAGRVSEVIEAR
ncbi:glycosyltransferase [Terrabacter sp. 2TAF16]|uniref:glycosyltransferase n=1 Tax=Terrabacter sp. 2TAF16 TaxID=3233008 RepID=UPI003F9C7517